MTKILYSNTFALDSSTRLIRIQKAPPADFPGEAYTFYSTCGKDCRS